jgi:PAS domain S-box-containing protein
MRDFGLEPVAAVPAAPGSERHPKSIRAKTLRAQLMMLALIALLPGLLAWSLYLRSEWNAALDNAYNRARNLVERVASDFDGSMRDYELSLAGMAAQGDIQAMDPARCLPVVSSYAKVHLEFTSVTLHDPSGRAICSSLSHAVDKPPPELRPYFEQALREGRLVVTDPLRGTVSGRWVTALGYPVRDDSGAALGVLVATLDLVTTGDRMLAGIREPGFSEEVLTTALDRKLRVAMRARDAETWIGKPLPAELTRVFKGGGAGDFRRRDLDSVTRIWAYSTAPRAGWLFVLGLPEEEALGGYRAALTRSIVLGVLLILLLLGAIWWLSGSIAAPMRKLAQAAKAVAGGDLAARAEPDGAAEVREVARQFNQMMEAIGQHRQQDEQLQVLETCVAQINDMVLITTAAPLAAPGPRIVFVNDAFVRTTGFARAQVVGQNPRLLQGPLTEAAELARIRSALERSEPVHAELVNYASNGLPYWVEMEIVPVSVGDERKISYFVAVQRDITERKQQEAALRELNAELESRVRSRTEELKIARDEALQANRAKSAFLATMSHEIRTPMNGVIGMVEVLQQAQLQQGQLEMVELIRESAFSLLGLIDSILDFSKIEAGHLSLEQRVFDLPGLIEKVCQLQDQGAQARGVRLSYCIDPAIPAQLLGDETRIRQILVNLLGNAIKFSSGGATAGMVRVSARLLEQRRRRISVELRVTDNGIGMDAATVARLFKPFTQADASTTRRFGGTGLGLAISANLLGLMQGTIAVDSRPGEGASFRVVLPLDRLAEDAEPPPVWAGGLHCMLIGAQITPQPLLDDLRVSLQRLGIAVADCPDPAAAATAAAAGAPQAPGASVWLVAPGVDVPAPERLPTQDRGDAGAPTRWVLLRLDEGRGVRALAADVVGADLGALSLRTLRRWLCAGASGRDDEDAAPPPVLLALPPAPTRDEAIRQHRLVLVAEDNETNRKVIARQLALIGIAADIAVNGREALDCWRARRYALVLTDLHMPEMDGYELAAAIRAEEPHGQRTPIVALTANAMRSEEQRCLREGMDAYLTKPIQLPQLRQAIEDWLKTSAMAEGKAAPERSLRAPDKPTEPAAPAKPAQDPTPAGRPPPADLSVLTELVGDDAGVIAELLQSFRDSALEVCERLRHGLQGGTPNAASQAHKLKSGARSIGAHRLAELCAAIEAAGAGGAERLPALIDALDGEVQAVLEFIAPSMRPRHRTTTEARDL